MKLFELIDIYNMVYEIVGNNAKIQDFAIYDENNELYVTLDNGKDFSFILNKKELDNE